MTGTFRRKKVLDFKNLYQMRQKNLSPYFINFFSMTP